MRRLPGGTNVEDGLQSWFLGRLLPGTTLGEWTKNYGSAATERKIYVGKGIRYFSNIGVAEFLVEAAEVSVGDKLLITGPTTGAEFVTFGRGTRRI